MTYGSLPVLRRQAGLADDWLPKLLSRDYDRRFRPPGEKAGALVGMGMTEKQGGSDLRSNSTQARPAGTGASGAEYRVTGHKWFFSAPMCDAFLVLTRAPGGLSCFFMPRWTPDGALNAIHLQRLKDKLGNRANASSEAEFRDAYAVLLGEDGRGVPSPARPRNRFRRDSGACPARRTLTASVRLEDPREDRVDVLGVIGEIEAGRQLDLWQTCRDQWLRLE